MNNSQQFPVNEEGESILTEGHDTVDNYSVNSSQDESPSKKPHYTKRQWTIFGSAAIIMFFSATCYSIQGPFFPGEASRKGISQTLVGLVFGVFELVDFIMCPIYGNYIGIIGPKFMLNAGNFLMASCCIIFGFLDRSPPGTPFIALAFAVRIVEALGQAGFITAVYAIIAYEFPDNIATTFSILETLAGVGVVFGPSVGGFLYEAGGFYLPFVSVGGLLLCTALLTSFILPHIEDSQEPKPSFFRLLRIPTVLISYYTCVATAVAFTFLQPILAPYLDTFGLSTSIVSVLFVINGAVYALTAILWGFLADKHLNPKILCALGSVFMMLSYMLIGPASFIPLKPSIWLVVVALILNGLGIGAEYVAAFLDCNRTVLKHGFPNNTETYGMVSGMWASALALGSFTGPSIAGALSDAVGFQNACLLNVGLHFLVFIFSISYLIYERRSANSITTGYVPIPD